MAQHHPSSGTCRLRTEHCGPVVVCCYRMRTVILVMLGSLALTPGVAPAQRRVTNLSGTWTLRGDSATAPAPTPRDSAAADSAKADSAAVVQPDSAGRPPQGPGGRRARTMGPNPRERQQIQRLMGMAQPVRSFGIEQTDSTLTITNDDGFSYTVRLDGRKTRLPLDDSVSVEAQAKWDDGALVIAYEPTGGGRLTETYHLADSRQYLRLEVTVEHKAMFRRFWQARMYRRQESAGS